MIRVGGEHIGEPGQDTEFCGLYYPDGDIITRHMAERLRAEPFYQHDKLSEALAVVKRRRGAIDCGAWVGGWSRELAKHFECVLAIEANPDNARCAMANVAGPANVAVITAALSDTTGEAVIDKDNGGANVGSFVASPDAPGCRVQTRRLDDLVATMQEIEPFAVDYIKVHVNGMELRTLHGAAKTIRKHRPVLTVVLKSAIESYGDSADATRAFLKDDLRYRPAGGERPYEIWVPA